MAKKVIRLNESQLRRMIKESVKRALMEEGNDIEMAAKKKFKEIDLDNEEFSDCGEMRGELDWEPTGMGGGQAYDTGEIEKDGWIFRVPIVWNTYRSGMGHEMSWDIDDSEDIEYETPDGQKGSFPFFV